MEGFGKWEEALGQDWKHKKEEADFTLVCHHKERYVGFDQATQKSIEKSR
jgi:hypothetical protein